MIVLRPIGGFAVEVNVRTLPGACRQHVDNINQALAAGEYEQAFYLAYQYFRAQVKHIQGRRREQDADGFRRQAAYQLAILASQARSYHPADEFRVSVPLVPGGDWRP